MQQPPQWVIDEAVKAARKSWCAKDQRGVVIWDGWGVVAETNGPPAPFKCSGSVECRASCGKLAGHAEERALLRWRGLPSWRPDASMLHIKLENDVPVPGGSPSCVGCSRSMLMAGKIAGMWLWLDAKHAGGSEPAWRWYDVVEFHTLSLLHPRNSLPAIR